MSDNDIDAESSTDEKIEDVKYSKTKSHFSKLRTELTDDDLQSTGVQKMLLADIVRLEDELIQKNSYQDKFYQADKKSAVLEEKQKTFLLSEILYSTSLTIGAVLMGLAPSIEKGKLIEPWMISSIGGILIIGAIITKVFKK